MPRRLTYAARRSLKMTEREAFSLARDRVLSEAHSTVGIGGLAEKTLHKILKLTVEPSAEFHEVEYLGFVADIKNGQGIYEIQTRSAERLIKKLEAFLPAVKVTVVIPVITEKTLRWLDKSTGEISEPKKSPKHESVYTAFSELYMIRRFLNSENLSVKMMLISVEEYKYLDGWDKTRHKGSTKLDRIPKELLRTVTLNTPEDYAALLPEELPEEFTSRELSLILKAPKACASAIAGVFSSVGAIEAVRRKGSAYIYKKS